MDSESNPEAQRGEGKPFFRHLNSGQNKYSPMYPEFAMTLLTRCSPASTAALKPDHSSTSERPGTWIGPTRHNSVAGGLAFVFRTGRV